MSTSAERPDPAAAPATAPAAGRVRAAFAGTSGLVRAGLAIFAAGLAVIAVAVIGFFLGVHNWPTWLNVCCGALAPLGLALALIGALSGGRRDQKQALRAVRQL